MSEAVDRGAIADGQIPLAGRRDEVHELLCALRGRQSRLITGPPGVGKTRLLAEALRGCDAPYILIRRPRVLHEVLVELAGMLACGVNGGASSMSLKPAILESLRGAPRVVILEDVAETGPRLRRLLWDPREEIRLRPLKTSEASQLFGAAVTACKLNSLDLDVFGRQVLRSARGNPGQIVEMCRLAARPEYWQGRRVKFVPLRMDALPAFIG